jgi:hypothetical protein
VEDENLAQWLKEAGRRTVARPLAPVNEVYVRTPAVPSKRGLGIRIALQALLLVAGLQYIYIDTMLQIVSLQPLVVFVLVDGKLPTVM